MPHIIFNDVSIRNLKPTRKQIVYWDRDISGFGIRVHPGGTKTWIVMLGRERRRLKLGNYPGVTVKDARRIAQTKFAQVTLGLHRRKTATFAEAIDLFEAAHCRRLRHSTRYELMRLLRKYFLPKLGQIDVAELEPYHFLQVTDRLPPGTGWHCFAAARTMMNWCVPRFIKFSPLMGIKRPFPPKSRTRVLNDDELRRVWKAAGELGHYGAIVRMLIITGQRRGEIAALQSAWINGNTITLPAHAVKNGREHVFTIGVLAAEIIAAYRSDTHMLLFHALGTPAISHNTWSRNKIRIDKATGITGWTLHDLRRTFATNHARLGTPIHITERLLNHVSGSQGGIVGVYQRYNYHPEMTAAQEKYERHLAALFEQP